MLNDLRLEPKCWYKTCYSFSQVCLSFFFASGHLQYFYHKVSFFFEKRAWIYIKNRNDLDSFTVKDIVIGGTCEMFLHFYFYFEIEIKNKTWVDRWVLFVIVCMTFLIIIYITFEKRAWSKHQRSDDQHQNNNYFILWKLIKG